MIQSMVSRVSEWDSLVSLQLYRLQRMRPLCKIMTWFSRSGDGYLYVLIGILLIGIDRTLGLQVFICGISAFLFKLPFYILIKRGTKRLRPFENNRAIAHLIAPPDKFSFPSGHTAGAFIMAGVLGNFLPMLLIPLFLWAIVVGLSRIYLGVHYPSDVIAGAVLGISSAQFGIIIF